MDWTRATDAASDLSGFCCCELLLTGVRAPRPTAVLINSDFERKREPPLFTRSVSLCNGAPRLCPRPVAEESGRKAWHSSARRMCDRKVWHSSAAASAGPAANVEVWTNAANV